MQQSKSGISSATYKKVVEKLLIYEMDLIDFSVAHQAIQIVQFVDHIFKLASKPNNALKFSVKGEIFDLSFKTITKQKIQFHR